MLLDTRKIPSKHSAKDMEKTTAKFAARKVEPFEIIKMINPNLSRPNIPDIMKRISPTYNVGVLSKYEPTPERFLRRPIPKASEFVDNGAEDHH